MKHIKSYENLNNQIHIGDYVVVNDSYHALSSKYSISYVTTSKNVCDFISSNIGKVHRINDIKSVHKSYDIDYNNVPDNIKNEFKQRYINKNYKQLYMTYQRVEIIFSSKNKEEAQTFINSKKYNL